MKALKVFSAGVAGFIGGSLMGCLVGLVLSIPFLGMLAIVTVPWCGIAGGYKGAVTAAQAAGKRVYGHRFNISEPVVMLACSLLYLVLILITLARRLRL